MTRLIEADNIFMFRTENGESKTVSGTVKSVPLESLVDFMPKIGVSSDCKSSDKPADDPAIAAIFGAVVAQELIKIVTQRNLPITGLFHLSEKTLVARIHRLDLANRTSKQ